MKRCLAILALGCAALGQARADDKAAAETLFVNAKKHARAGDVAAACPLFEASYRADPQLGVLLNLADCHEALGRTGIAWAEFREAMEMAARRNDPREDFARRRAQALEPRLIRLHVVVDPTPGLVVKRNGVDVSLLVAQDVVVDPDIYTIEAFALGHRTWSTTVDVRREGTIETVTVPTLEREPDPEPAHVAPIENTVVTPHPARVVGRERSALRTWALVVGSVGLGVAGTGLAVGAYAWSEWQGTRDPSMCDPSNICSPQGQAQIASARSHARTSTYLTAAGSAMVGASIIMLLIAPRTNAVVTPTLGEHGAGVSVSGGF
ncbi:MAG: tetratricopeptide repeat protein [Kofleriaceae bacterium]